MRTRRFTSDTSTVVTKILDILVGWGRKEPRKNSNNVEFAHCRIGKIFPAGASVFSAYFPRNRWARESSFLLTNGNRHDIEEVENFLRGRMGTAIDDKSYRR
ncbi:MAG: hypothetical protein LBF26_01470 [Puniceicoccales bacterium]|jgi:hypothetical protein|nr:hypothetical protein [Puniceicoccales bacterium]